MDGEMIMNGVAAGLGWLFVLLVGSVPLSAAKADPMADLGFLVGEWEGEGWIRRGPDDTHRFHSRETVEARLGGRILTVHGRHHDFESGAIVHDAFAVISAREGGYRFSSYLSDGRSGEYVGWLEEGDFIWEMSLPEVGKIRYTLKVDTDTWNEVGRMSRDGENWHEIFGMQLTRVKP